MHTTVVARLTSLVGLFAMIGLAWLMSERKRHISLRVVAGGVLLQFAFAMVVLKTAPGRAAFVEIGNMFSVLLSHVDAGSEFVFGQRFHDFYFAFKVLPTIIFFSALMSVLYYLRVMQFIVLVFGRLMERTLGTTGPESLAAAANIFLGQTEAPLVVRPYVPSMTRSELMATMVPGFASTAGGVLAAYVSMGIDAGHLVAASVMSAPAGLLIAKVIVPESEKTLAPESVLVEVSEVGENLIESAAIGAAQGVKLAINVAAMLIAFLALIAMVDGMLGWVGDKLGWQWSLSAALSYLFAPIALLMGVEPADCFKVGELLGVRMVTNELVSYEMMAEWMRAGSGVELSPRSEVILTYALCGFANFSSIGIQIGGIGGIAPNRRTELSRLGLRAMLGGTLACFMTACVAGVLI
jgi:CNT family concentrative nucleoside transporter